MRVDGLLVSPVVIPVKVVEHVDVVALGVVGVADAGPADATVRTRTAADAAISERPTATVEPGNDIYFRGQPISFLQDLIKGFSDPGDQRYR
jgi:hypothetical protein